MQRSYYCKEETLRKYCEDLSSWKFQLLKRIPSFHLLSSSMGKVPESFEEYLDASEGRSNCSLPIVLGDLLERPVTTFDDLYSIDFSQVGNSLFEDINLPESIVTLCGVEVIGEDGFTPLMRHWFDNTIKGDKCFFWNSFLKEGEVQMSNSLIIMDRYLFKAGVITDKKTKKKLIDKQYLNGCKNIGEILDTIISESFIGEYQVLFVFDDEQITEQLTLKEVLLEICQEIPKCLKNKRAALKLEFLGVHNGQNYDHEDEPDFRETNRCLKSLYGLTHDRRILSNYFMVNATHGWNAVDYKRHSSKETQAFYFDSLFSGVDNPDQIQIKNSIPIEYIQSFVDDFVSKLSDAKENTYSCYQFDTNSGLKQIPIHELQNRVLLLSTNPIRAKRWDPASRLFSRDNHR